jgi:CRISPR/Cas system-associated exonuclease Cas4 (RecB family)
MLEATRGRLESPTSVLTYMQCPHKYYYRYVRGLEQKLKGSERKPSVYVVMGGIVHSTIEAFHKTDVAKIPPKDFFGTLRSRTIEYLNREWCKSRGEFGKLDLNSRQMGFFYGDAMSMITNFCRDYMNKLIACQYRYHLSPAEAFQALRPKTDTKMTCERLGVTGVVDAIHNFNGKTVIIDYKTSKKSELDLDCLVQLGIYALLYRESQGGIPYKVGVHFLRYGERVIRTSPELLALGEEKCAEIRNLTRKANEPEYPRKVSGLCKYSSGQCDYYETCMPERRMNAAVGIESDRKPRLWC